MRFDDRLLTVLSQPAGDRHDVAVRWRQLVDLVARAGSNAVSATVGDALESIRKDAPKVDENLRAAAARAVAALPLPLGLLEYFASDRLAVSAPVLAAATLDPGQWQAILSCADEETRRFVETLHPATRLESVREQETPGAAASEQPPQAAGGGPSLHDVVQRIERRRRVRTALQNAAESAAAAQIAPALFRWECGPGGEIAWVEGAPRGALIGRSLARPQNGDGDHMDTEVLRAFALRAPFRDAALKLAGEGITSGDWKISGVPAFDPADGRFAGYRGIALREQAEAPPANDTAELVSDPASLRELVHEVKTPLNAIMGFAEIIEGQYLGPADERYRERAREIVRQAKLLLTAIDDLDFAAKLHSVPAQAPSRANLGELVERMMTTLRDVAAKKGVEIDAARTARETWTAVEPELADRLIFRMCSAVIDAAVRGERLRLLVDQSDRVRVSITKPERLHGLSEVQLLGASADLDYAASLRLVRGLARIAGVEMVAPEGSICLQFPRG